VLQDWNPDWGLQSTFIRDELQKAGDNYSTWLAARSGVVEPTPKRQKVDTLEAR